MSYPFVLRYRSMYGPDRPPFDTSGQASGRTVLNATEYEIIDFFAEWPEKYDMWFETPIDRLVGEYESRLLPGMARPGQGAPLTAPSLGIDSDHGQARKGERRE